MVALNLLMVGVVCIVASTVSFRITPTSAGILLRQRRSLTAVWKEDGVESSADHLPRDSLLQTVETMLDTEKVIMLSTTAGTGKTTLLDMLKERNPNKCHYVDLKIPSTPVSELVKKATDFAFGAPFNPTCNRKVIVMLDDAQEKFKGKLNRQFWSTLVKSKERLPDNIRFIISATHSVRISGTTPADLGSLSKLTRNDFLLSPEEVYALLDISIGMLKRDRAEHVASVLNDSFVRDAIVAECGGIVSAVTQTVNAFQQKFRKQTACTPSEALQFLMSREILDHYWRCFPLPDELFSLSHDTRTALTQCIIDGTLSTTRTPSLQLRDGGKQRSTAPAALEQLVQRGILTEITSSIDSTTSVQFVAPLAERYISSRLFPHRSNSFAYNVTAFELVTDAIKSMSASDLANSVVHLSGDFPIESVWQHHLYPAFLRATSHTCRIRTEIARLEPLAHERQEAAVRLDKKNRADFWIDGALRIGIETLVGGRERKSHNQDFLAGGRYAQLAPLQHAIVDFRRTSVSGPGRVSNEDISPTSMTVFFQPENKFHSCWIQYGMNETAVEVHLRP